MSTGKRRTKPPYPAELRERAVRLVGEAERDGRPRGPALRSVAEKLGCSVESLRNWVRQAEATKSGADTLDEDERARLKALERENRELRQANEILRKASAYFAQAELDRRFKP
jgi:transposase